MIKLSRLCACTGALFLLLGTRQATAQAFTNGSFEMGTAGSVGSSSTAVTGWTTTVGGGTGAGVYRGNNSLETWVPTAQSGTYALQLDGSSPTNDQAFLSGAQTTVSQTFTLLSAGTYRLSFYMSGEAGATKTGTVGVLVSLSGLGLTAGTLTNKEFTISNTGATTGSWTQQTATFTVGNASQTITLTFTDDNTHTGSAGAYTSTLANYTTSSNVALDNVAFTAVVPEPSALVGSGVLLLMAAVGARLRRRVA